MSSKVAKGLFTLAVVVALMAMAPATADADGSLGQFCWKLDPFVDTMRIDVSTGAGPATMFNLHARWRGATSYQLLGAGEATASLLSVGKFDLGLEMAHNTTFFGGNKSCNFFAVLDPSTLAGTWLFQCPGPTHFTNSGTFTPKTCASTDAAEGDGPVAGQ